jgi:L-threonylcarbamoyladenylate synthase
MAEEHAHFSPLARRLATRFWPGPLTLVLPRKTTSAVSDLVTAGLPSIGLRIPQHIATLGIISRVGRPLAAPSANPSEQLSPTTAAHVAAGLGARIDLIVDGGAAVAGVESTIIAPGETHAVMLRPGAIARADIELLTGPLGSPEAAEGILAPGMMKRHYAPRARLRMDATNHESGEAFLAFGAPPPGVSPSLNLSIRGDLTEAASNLFAMLRALDERHTMIAVQTIPETGLGEAINDRLRRGTLLSRESGV